MAEDRYFIQSTLKIVDKEYGVYSVELEVADNGIPTITLMVTPPGSPYSLVTIQEYLNKNAELQLGKGKKDVKIEFYLSISSEGDDYSFVEIDLKNWVMVDSGVTSISAAGSAGMKVVIQHPIYRLTRIPLTMGVEYYSVKNKNDNKSKDLISAIEYGMNRYLDTHDPKKSTTPSFKRPKSKIAKQLRGLDIDRVQELRDLLAELKTLTEWKAPQVFPFPDDTQFKPYLKKYLAHPKLYGPYSIYDGMLSQLIPMHLGVSGTFSEDPLWIIERNPWEEPSFTVYDTDVSKLDMPPMEVPLEGTVLLGKDHVGGLVDYLARSSKGQDGVNSATSGVLAGFLDWIDKLDGRIDYVDAPQWMLTYQLHAKINFASKGKRTPDYVAKNNRVSKAAKERHKERYKALLQRYCEDIFYDRLYKGTKARLVTRLMLTGPPNNNDSGSDESSSEAINYLRPGTVIALKQNLGPDVDEEVMLRAYVTHVNHTIDVRNGTAATSIAVSHATGPEGVALPDGETVVKERKLSIYNKPEG